MKLVHTEDYAALRAAAYPDVREFADALYWQSRGDASKLEAYFEKIDEVKQRFPKPVNSGDQ